MSIAISLSQYVKKRTGVALGASGSMRNMLERSLGAPSFYVFWRYWNPIWSYYLSRFVMKPIADFLPNWCAVLVTFAVSGALHDLAVMLIKWRFIYFFTPWFILMGGCALVSLQFKLSFPQLPWFARAAINLIYIVGSFLLVDLFF
ncbi:acyltransferase [Pseudoalteromonas haloplanktis]|uniref:Acyltransferase n=1 Tax=Pseudoalteromonas haloplanktis TaxID=228 RepID=A0ABU1B9K8_PSEHA|nr:MULTISPECIES: MBOAT family O-acyltransferase [Pseudoalteromonas]MDQ9091045.1 acyltransferase [Pseudoalteromonas haloplanktis]TMN69916.1 acyltransferase [Pseudoalteromonas sp. S1727]